jgi:2-succinyl-5-enolpyruvyl-6-hydroxy-3-cyclohexene-1-carboxylate synthase
MISNKRVVRNLIENCAVKGIKYIIISPGSRNAPLNISFNEDERFQCISVPDERVAAFIALGIGQQTGIPALISCTSGTAALNYASGIAEAYYQQIPMLVVTADRPPEWTNQGDGQTINQTDVFHNYIKKSYDLPVNIEHKEEDWSANRMISEAIEQTMNYGTPGPVQLNMPFREPLYKTEDYSGQPLPKTIQTVAITTQFPKSTIDDLMEIWNRSDRILILVGLLPIQHELNDVLGKLMQKDKRVVVLTETTANLNHPDFCPAIDRVIETFDFPEETQQFKPDLLITVGHSIVSKKIKSLLRPGVDDVQPFRRATWHIGKEQFHLDTMQSLTHHIPAFAKDFFEQFIDHIAPNSKKEYAELWQNRSLETIKYHYEYLKTCEWSDFKAFEQVLDVLPQGTNLQMGNSSAVRYVLLFPQREDVIYNSNRGVAGIDGCTSTAIGAAMVNKRPTTVITGDISFFYDSNAFWNSNLPENLRVILINNGGGNIFRIIPGPDTTNQLADYFETHHNLQSEHVAKLFDLNYYKANSDETLAEALKIFYGKQANGRPAILEIVTPRLENDKILKQYFKFLKAQIGTFR